MNLNPTEFSWNHPGIVDPTKFAGWEVSIDGTAAISVPIGWETDLNWTAPMPTVALEDGEHVLKLRLVLRNPKTKTEVRSPFSEPAIFIVETPIEEPPPPFGIAFA